MTSINQVDQYDSDDGFEDAFQRWMAEEKLDQPYIAEWFEGVVYDLMRCLGAHEAHRFPRQADVVLWDVYGFSDELDAQLSDMFEETR
jgi:hypothetical protein